MNKPIFLLFFFAMLTSTLARAEELFQNKIDHFVASDGHHLRYLHLRPLSCSDTKKPIVIFVQGRNTFLEYYSDLYAEFLQRGFEIYSYDLTGQGGSSRVLPSEPLKQHVEDFSLYTKHLDEFIGHVANSDISNVLLVGYSLGGNVVTRYLVDAKIQPRGAILLSPLTYAQMPWPLPYFAIDGLSRAFTAGYRGDAYMFGKGDKDPVFTDPKLGQKYTSDPDGAEKFVSLRKKYRSYVLGGVTYAWFKAATDSTRYIESHAHKITTKILFLTAGKDSVVDTSANAQLAKLMPRAKHVSLIDARHEMFREKPEIRKELWKQVDEFLKD